MVTAALGKGEDTAAHHIDDAAGSLLDHRSYESSRHLQGAEEIDAEALEPVVVGRLQRGDPAGRWEQKHLKKRGVVYQHVSRAESLDRRAIGVVDLRIACNVHFDGQRTATREQLLLERLHSCPRAIGGDDVCPSRKQALDEGTTHPTCPASDD